MGRWRALSVVLLVFVLSGCGTAFFTDLPAQNPFETADPDFWSFLSYCESHWTYEKNDICLPPSVSYDTMRGDCDDFAVMIAAFAQEGYGYDSFVAEMTWDGVGHAVAFIHSTASFKNEMVDYCGSYSYLTVHGEIYIPIDLPGNGGICPVWEWTSTGPGGPPRWEWYELVGQKI